jgi:hypothetical protein
MQQITLDEGIATVNSVPYIVHGMCWSVRSDYQISQCTSRSGPPNGIIQCKQNQFKLTLQYAYIPRVPGASQPLNVNETCSVEDAGGHTLIQNRFHSSTIIANQFW